MRHSRKYLATDDPELLIKLQKVMGLLAFPKGTKIAAYKELMDENRSVNNSKLLLKNLVAVDVQVFIKKLVNLF